jgi:hypothetical protein
MKKLVIAILIIMAAVLLYAILTPKQEFTELDLSLFPNTVENYSSIPYADTVAHVALDLVGIEYTYVAIFDIPSSVVIPWLMQGEYLAGFVIAHGPRDYALYMNSDLSRTQYLKFMAHEVIHIEQVYQQRLNLDNYPMIYFEGDSIHVDDYEYRQRP